MWLVEWYCDAQDWALLDVVGKVVVVVGRGRALDDAAPAHLVTVEVGKRWGKHAIVFVTIVLRQA